MQGKRWKSRALQRPDRQSVFSLFTAVDVVGLPDKRTERFVVCGARAGGSGPPAHGARPHTMVTEAAK